MFRGKGDGTGHASRLKMIGLKLIPIVLLLLVATAQINVHKTSTAAPLSDSSAPWILPQIDTHPNNVDSIAIGAGQWHTDFYQLESVWDKIPVSEGLDIIVGADTEAQLQKIVGVLGEDLSTQEWSRAEWLINKHYARRTASQMTRLIANYHGYTQTYQASRALIARATGAQKTQLLQVHRQEDKQQQVYFLGFEIAQKLFAKRNHTRDYFTERQLINLDSALTEQQKRDQNALVERRYKSGLE